MKNQIEYLEKVICNCDESIDWMSRPDQDDDYVVCGLGWKAVQEKRITAKRNIESLKEKGYYYDYEKSTGYRAYCKDDEQISVRNGQYGKFGVIDGKCYSDKKMKAMGYIIMEEVVKVDINGVETLVMA